MAQVDVDVTFTSRTISPARPRQPRRDQHQRGRSVTVNSPAFTDNAGNTTAAGVVSKAYRVDKTKPTVRFNSGTGTSYYFGREPAAPTCDGSDVGGSGIAPARSPAAPPRSARTPHRNRQRQRRQRCHRHPELHRPGLDRQGLLPAGRHGGVFNTVKGGEQRPVKFDFLAGSTELLRHGHRDDECQVDLVQHVRSG